jgi:NAD(P)-dependent dehydrogenase (short-subunit alcohol dehydrogenase family)
MGKLDGKVALVTGGSSGIGLATAACFVAEGAKVWVTGRDECRLEAALSELGPDARGVRGDVTSAADLDGLFARIGAEDSRLDVVFANAAVMEMAPLATVDEAHVQRVLAVNLSGVLFTVQKALPLIPDGGAVILAGSLGAHHGWADQGVYAASKAAVRSLARTWTTELRERGIRVNVVSPGATATRPDDDDAAELAAMIPAGRLATPTEIARAALFLASDDASYLRGAELCVDGGLGHT